MPSPSQGQGLLSCSICGHELEFRGKNGAILNTKCSHCGMSSDSLVDNAPPPRTKEIKVYYRGKAPMSVPP
ncbi:ribosomal L1 domain-containing protein [Candidatus Pacearchaeota archaeon]|nr:ribosomal L1 domain-containing protein [Candidatus Pacearchaeota archaeon]